jgi:hypothetical protein
MKLRIPAAITLLLLTLLAASGQDRSGIYGDGGPLPPNPTSGPMTRGQYIYACHHSYFQPVPAILTELARSGGFAEQDIIGTHYIGGSKSIQHWNIPDPDNQAKQALISGNVDVLILTPVYLPDDGIEKFAWLPFDVYNPLIYDPKYQRRPGEPPLMPKPAKVDHNAATAEGLRKMHEYYFRTMDEHIIALNRQLGKQVLFVVPMGQAVLALREKIIAGQAPGLKVQEDLFLDQLGHPKPPLAALEAYCHYAVIYRKSPVGLPVPSVLTKSTIPPGDVVRLNRLLQKLAWDAVIHHPLSGVASGQANDFPFN